MSPTTSTSAFGKYELLEQIGAGGMAQIYKARVTGPGAFENVLVLKMILPEFAQNRAFIKMLVDEAKVTSLLHHPNIVQIFELGEIDARYYIAMEYVEGSDLLDVLARCTREKLRLPTDVALFIIAEVCKGLAHAHAATDASGRPLNIIHRDVSPSNILISFSGSVKIMDFGVAYADFSGTDRMPKLGPGAIKGKLGYMSPEQVTHAPLDRRSDVFALGVILFECLTLKRLFVGKTDVQTLLNVREADIERKFKRHSYIPKPIRAILRRALAKDPEDRFQTATDFQEAILDYLFESRMRVSQRTIGTFLNQLVRPRSESPAERPVSNTPPPTLSTPDAATVEMPALPEHASATPHRPSALRQVDLSRAVFRLRGDAGEVFGPIELPRLTTLLAKRAVAPKEWVSINGSDWIRAADVHAIVDLQPSLFEEEPDRPLYDGPVNRVLTPHVFHQISSAGLDGKLKLTAGTTLKEIYFDNGTPVAVFSNLKYELLGAYLLRDGLVSPQHLAATLDLARAEELMLGDALRHTEIISAEQLDALLERQFRDRVLEIFSWERGWYEFFPGYHAQPTFVGLHETPPQLLMKGIRRYYDGPALQQILSECTQRPMVVSRNLAAIAERLACTPDEASWQAALQTDETLAGLTDQTTPGEDRHTALLRLVFALYQTDALAFRVGAAP